MVCGWFGFFLNILWGVGVGVGVFEITKLVLLTTQYCVLLAYFST